jgi:hypothetical protein
MLGWFGGFGFSGMMGFFTGTMHIPAPFPFLAIAAEFFEGLGLNAWIPHPHNSMRNRAHHGGSDCDRE